ncbi:MAG TPA: hypothetical protein VLA76_06900 [Candidatus Angelobacter sp.]|nr:hypothetical protein [Candidatus Angelobacter sp.]
MGETTDRQELVEALNTALPLVARDALHLAVASGSLPGPAGIALSGHLREMAAANLQDVERLAARIASLGGTPIARADASDRRRRSPDLEQLLEAGRATLSALVDAIPADADDAEGESTEHLLEHMVNRKRSELELLERALR